MLQYPYPIRLTPIWGKTMRQFSERFSSCRTQQEYTQVGIRIFRFFRTEGSNHFPDRRRTPICGVRHGNPIDFPMLQWELEEKPRPHYKPLLRTTIKRHNKLTARAGERPLLRPLRLPQKSGKQILKKIFTPLDNAPSSLYTMHCEQRSC